MGHRALALQLRAIQAWDRLALARRMRRHPGLRVDPAAGSNLAVARYAMAPGASLRIGPGVVTERIPGALRFLLEEGAEVSIGAGTWLRTELGPVVIAAFAGARIEIGPDAFLNGCHLSAKASLRLGRRAFVGPGTRVFDARQHDVDDARPDAAAAVSIGEHVWIASDCTVARGVTIGDHSVVGARSVVTHDIPDHSLAFGLPATVRGEVGDRSRAR